MIIFLYWLFLRTLSSFFVGMVSSIQPGNSLETIVPFYPPSQPVIQWLNRAFVSPWMRWDALWYERITAQGYSATNGTSAFQPLYPWLATILYKIGIPASLSLLLISCISGILLFYWFHKLAQLDLGPKDAIFSTVLFSLAPPAFILFAPYSEALFILLAVLCFYFLRKKAYWLAGLMGGLATLTRQQGIFLLFPFVWELWQNYGNNVKTIFRQWRIWLTPFLIPLGYLVWFFYRAFFITDVQIKTDSINGFIYSFLISPTATNVVSEQKFVWPWQGIYNAILKVIQSPDVDIWLNLIVAILFLIIVLISWKKMVISYRIYTLLIIIISFSFSTGLVHPYMGLPRHLFLGFPVFIGVAARMEKPLARLFTITIFALGMSTLLGLYVIKAWVP